MTKAYAAQLTIGTTLAAAPYWISALQAVNLVLGTVAAVIGILVGGHALLKILSGKE